MIHNKYNLNYFKNEGYVHLKKIIDNRKIKSIQKTIISRASLYFKNNYTNFYDVKFHKKLIEFKKKDKKNFGSFYDSIQKSFQIYDIFLDKNLKKKISYFSNLKTNNLSINGENIRMDRPNDNLHSLSWHQDRSYYFQNRDGNKGLVCWIPLMNLTKNLGPLRICKKSHLNGFIKSYVKSRKKNASTQRIVSPSNYEIVSPIVEEGDVLILNKNTIHASGKNTSKYFRFSCQVRLHDLLDPDYLSFRYKIFYNKEDIKKLKKKKFDISDIEKISI
jgi:hypothetical protein